MLSTLGTTRAEAREGDPLRVESETLLPVAADLAWRALTDWERQAEWMRDADSVRVLTTHREGPGVRIAVKTRVLNVPAFTEVLDVTEWHPPERLVVAHRGFVRGDGVWTLEPAPGGTRFRWVEILCLPVPLLGELALLVYRPFMRRLMRRALGDLGASLTGSR
jgi:uncharacterized protein YndB with AHSA1/START domain